MFDSTRVRPCRCYIYSRRAVKFFSHMFEKTLGYVTVSVGARTREREREREVVQGHRRLGGLSHSQAAIRSLSLGPEIRGIFMFPPPRHQERVGGRGKEDRLAHTQKSARNETPIDVRLQGPSYFSRVFTFLGPGCVNAADDGPRCVR